MEHKFTFRSLGMKGTYNCVCVISERRAS